MNINITSIGGVGSTYLSQQIEKAFHNEKNFSIIHGHLLHALKRPLKQDSKIIYVYGDCLQSLISRMRRNIFLRAWINFFRPLGSDQPNGMDTYKQMISFEERSLTPAQRTIHNIRSFNWIIKNSVLYNKDYCFIKNHVSTAQNAITCCSFKKENSLFLYMRDPNLQHKLSNFLHRNIEFELKPRKSSHADLSWFKEIDIEKTIQFYQKIDDEIINAL